MTTNDESGARDYRLQPIATAPKDGRSIVGCWNESGKKFRIIWWPRMSQRWIDDDGAVDEPPHWIPDLNAALSTPCPRDTSALDHAWERINALRETDWFNEFSDGRATDAILAIIESLGGMDPKKRKGEKT